MMDDAAVKGAPGGEMQFEQVEPVPSRDAAADAGIAAPTPTPVLCFGCNQPIRDVYFETQDKLVCPECREVLGTLLVGGSALWRGLRALVTGTLAAAAGAGLYYAIAAFTGYEIGLVAILVGLMVGGAVRWGARRRGGWRYQILAMALTYAAIVATYFPAVINALQGRAPTVVATLEASPDEAAAPAPLLPAEGVTDGGAGATASQVTAGGTRGPMPASAAGVVASLVVILGLTLAAPFLAGAENIIGLLIIGVGVYEAWRLNRRLVVRVSGPFKLKRASPEAHADAVER